MTHVRARRWGRALLLGPAAAVAACSHHSSGYPSYLPKDTLDVATHRIVDASVSSPALATQGDAVRVHLGTGTLEVTVSGPGVPAEGLPVQPTRVPASWTVQLTDASVALRVDPHTFEAIDGAGEVYKLTTPQRQVLLQPGRTVAFTLRAKAFQVGEGRIRWIPSGHLAPVEWDFTAETD